MTMTCVTEEFLNIYIQTKTFGAAVTSTRPFAFIFPWLFVTSAPRFTQRCYNHTGLSASAIAMLKPTIFHSCTHLERSTSSSGRRWWHFSLSELHLQCISMSTNVMPNQSRVCSCRCNCCRQQVWHEQNRMYECSPCWCSSDEIVTHQDIRSSHHISPTTCIWFPILVCDQRTTIGTLQQRCVILPHA